MSTEPDAPPSDDDATRNDGADDDLATLEHFPQLIRRVDLIRSRSAFPEHPTLCMRLPDGKSLEVEHDPRLKELDWIDRQKFLRSALVDLAITPHEYLEFASGFFEAHADDDPSTLAQWLKISRIVRAAYYEAKNANSEFLKKADAAARPVLEDQYGSFWFSARSVAFKHLRDETAISLELGLKTEVIASFLWTSMSEAKYHEIARHIPDPNRATISKRQMLDKLDVARAKPFKPDDFHEQAEYIIRAWLRAMGCPDEIVKGAFDAERARDERELGLRER